MSFTDGVKNAAKQFRGLQNLGLAATTSTTTLIYLGVPFGNALLIGVVVTLQASLGFLVLKRILPDVQNSFLFLLGPGVIIGGALSFFLFQIVGRGWIGLIATLTAGLASVLKITHSNSRQNWKDGNLWYMFQIFGLAALALTWEFGALLPAAIAFFILGFFTSEFPQVAPVVRWSVGVGAGGVILTAIILRQDYWWLVTDDYQFFEVMSRHFIRSGPLADWGVSNWSRYHWLPYGWSGLLNHLGGNLESFVTLTRVMPGLYSLSLGASLTLIASVFEHNSKNGFFTTLPVWTVIAFHRLDWSGTSTSGVYAVIAAVAVMIMLEFSTSNSVRRRAAVYAIGIPIIALTKFPSLFAIFVFVMLIEIWNRYSMLDRGKRLLLLTSAPFVVVLLAIAAIDLGSYIVGGWKFVTVNPDLGQLAEFGPLLAGTGLAMKKLWILVPILCVVQCVDPRSPYSIVNIIRGLAYCTIPLLLLGIHSDVRIFGNANTADYFSGPMYFLSSLLLLPLVPSIAASRDRIRVKTTFFSSLTFLFIGVMWTSTNFGVGVIQFLGVQLFQWNSNSGTVLQEIFGEGRFAIALIWLLGTFIGFWHRCWRPATLVASLLALTVFTMVGYAGHSRSDFARKRSVSELAQNIGSAEIQSVGLWLKDNSMPDDLIATNHIVDSTGKLSSSFDLAVWSERTFLLLGPRFGGESPGKERAAALSLRFAENPSEETCNALSEYGVRWFVIDLRLTRTRSWSACTTTAYEHKDFLVLRLTR